jgi:hypothetical protein
MTLVRDRPLDHATQAKLNRLLLRQANRDRLARIRIAVDRINQEIAAARDKKRLSVGGHVDCFEDGLLRRLRNLRADLELLEV